MFNNRNLRLVLLKKNWVEFECSLTVTQAESFCNWNFFISCANELAIRPALQVPEQSFC
jgi:hypothetical protein